MLMSPRLILCHFLLYVIGAKEKKMRARSCVTDRGGGGGAALEGLAGVGVTSSDPETSNVREVPHQGQFLGSNNVSSFSS